MSDFLFTFALAHRFVSCGTSWMIGGAGATGDAASVPTRNVRGRHVADQILELIHFRQPFIGLIQVLDRRVNARGERLGVLGRDGVGADELDLLVEPVLFGDDQLQVRLGLLAALLAFAQHLQPFQARTRDSVAWFQDARVAPLAFSASTSACQARCLRLRRPSASPAHFRVARSPGTAPAIPRCPAGAGRSTSARPVCAGADRCWVGGRQQVVRTGGFDVAANLGKSSISLAALRRKAIEQRCRGAEQNRQPSASPRRALSCHGGRSTQRRKNGRSGR